MSHRRISEFQTFMNCIWNSFLFKTNILRIKQNFWNLKSFFIKGYMLKINIYLFSKITFIKLIHSISFFLELIIRKDKMFQEFAFGASHVLHQISWNKTHLFFDLFDELITVLQIEMPEGENFFQIVSQQFTPHIDSTSQYLYLLMADLTGSPSKKGVI